MKIQQMDRKTVQLLSDAITQALQPLAAQYGVKIDRGSASYNDQNFTLKVSVAVIGEGGVAVSKEVTDFKRYAEFKGLKADDLGRTVSISGKPYTIAGYLVRSTRNPILVKDSKGKSWRMPLYLVTEALNKVRGKVKAPPFPWDITKVYQKGDEVTCESSVMVSTCDSNLCNAPYFSDKWYEKPAFKPLDRQKANGNYILYNF
jgi:hypothetical protein